jgi:hypothetical protein
MSAPSNIVDLATEVTAGDQSGSLSVTSRITSADELEYCRPFIGRAYENRFGKRKK